MKKRVTKKMSSDLKYARKRLAYYQNMVDLIEEVIVTSIYLDIADEKSAQLERALDGAKAPRKSKRSTGSPRK